MTAMNHVREARRKTILAWRDFATAERRTAWGLLQRGFLCRHQPALILEGQKPDYLTLGRGRMWVEVKSLDPPASQTLLGTARNELKPRLAAIAGPCRVDAQVSGGYDQRSATIALSILQRELAKAADGDVFYVGIPADAVKKSPLVTIEYASSSSSVRMFTPRSASGMYGYPRWASPANWSAELTIRDGQNVAQERAYKVLEAREPCVIMLRVERRPTHHGLGSMSNGEAQDVTTVSKMRERIEDAASQLRNARKYLDAPAVVSVYNDHFGDHEELLRACLGDITIEIDRATGKGGEPFLGRNGVMRPDKNTTVSAVTYSSRVRPSFSLLNPHATLPVRPSWLAGTVYQVQDNGEVVVVRG
jgi:hypothetical protein